MPPGPGRGPLRVRRSEGASEGGVRRPASRLADMVWIIALAVVGLAVGWSILSTAMADRLAGDNPRASLGWRRDEAVALVGMAERELGAGRLSSAESYARRALAADPLQIPALRVMGLAADRRGDAKRAWALMRAAGARNHRDPALQVWLLGRSAARGDYEDAFARADALARAEPDLSRRLFPLLMDLAGRPGAVSALAGRLATNPPWRTGFLISWIRQAPGADGPISVMDSMALQGAPATAVEKRAIQTRLVRDGRFQQAFVLWAQDLPPAQLNTLADVNDSGFDGGFAEGPFTWAFEPQSRGVVEIEKAPGRDGQALHLYFDGRPAPQTIVRQLLILPPGARVLTGEVRADRFEAIGGLVWAIRCTGGSNAVLAESPPLVGPADWRRFSVAFEVPAGCDGQWLMLIAKGQNAGARRMSGEAWFDNIAVTR